ncbi:deoxyribose-phosphate aldolase [bacterium]|nr:deoxyribose-phosphate aldolase [bacterium]
MNAVYNELTGGPAKPHSLAGLIDHTLLKPEANEAQIIQLCREAMQYGFYSVCVNPCWVQTCSQQLAGSGVKVCSVIGFPFGAHCTCLKVAETERAVQDGAAEVDMVLNVGRLKSGNFSFVRDDIQRVVRAAHPSRVKVILETCLLTDEEKITACVLAKEAGAHFVKTSTGFNVAGATTEDVALMRRVVGEALGVKASGGIRDRRTALAMIAAGANRLGVSAGIAIVTDTTAAPSA